MSFLKARKVFTAIRRTMGYMHTNRDPYWVERIGDREMLTYGRNGLPIYIDERAFPFPAIRYKEITPEIEALFQKQIGDWRYLTKDEKKALYRASFCQTYAEFTPAPIEWMEITGYLLMLLCGGFWLYLFIRVILNEELPESFKASNRRAQLRRQIDLKMNPVEGLASVWDYDKMDWKVKRWNTPPNPFVRCDDD